MKLLFFTEARLSQTLDGKYFSANQSFSFQMFKRYLKVFDGVLVVARSAVVGYDTVDEDVHVENDGVKVLPLPYYIGPYQYLRNRKKISKVLKAYIDSNPSAAVICRVPGIIGATASRYLIKKDRPYGVEVVGDPYDLFARGSFRHLFRELFKRIYVRDLKTAIKYAAASIYVTSRALQARYQVGNEQYSTSASNIMLYPEDIAGSVKIPKNNPPYKIVAVGTLSTMYKSPDIAIEAIAILKKRNQQVKLQWLGDGIYRHRMIDYAKSLNVADIIDFVGNVKTPVKVRAFLDDADLFVMPSRQEGLPRALVEAMARGLPCIGTEVGGIPELLSMQALVPINDAKSLADKIEHFLLTPLLAKDQARQNLKKAHVFDFNLLESRREKFYQYLRSKT